MNSKPKKIKVLILGIGQSNFLNQLYGEICKQTNQYEFSIDGYYSLDGKEEKNEQLPYKDFYDFNSVSLSGWTLMKNILGLMSRKFFYGLLLFELSQNSSFSHIREQIKILANQRYRAEKLVLPLNKDLYHFHFCVPHNIYLIYFLPKSANIICTFWGSDLLRLTGLSNIYYVRKALKKASKITVQTPELAEILYSKYGRDLTDKTKILRFTLNQGIFNQIDEKKEKKEEIKKFKEKYANSKKVLISVGHNSFSENNHIKIIQEIEKMPSLVLKNCAILLHMSYGGNSLYIKSVKDKIEEFKSLDICVVEDFFGPEEVALLRLSTDIMVQMPVSDALSAAMTEVMYAGNLVIAGAWLPYGIFRRRGVVYQEIDNFQDLSDILERIINNLDFHKERAVKNSVFIRKFFSPEQTTPAWQNLLEEVSQDCGRV